MGYSWYYLQRLCRHPHRGSATGAEAAAAADLKEWLSDLGYQVTEQLFSAPRDTLYLGPAIVFAGFVLAAGGGLVWPWVGLLLCLLLMIPMVGEMMGSAVDFNLLLPCFPSHNLIAKKGALQQAARTIVISAHYDTQRASYLFHPSFLPWLQFYFYYAYATFLTIPLLLSIRWILGPTGWNSWILGIAALLTALNAAFLLACRLTGQYVNGANDNGSGVAVLLALAKRLAEQPLAGVEVLFLLTGSEEVGTRGMKHFINQISFDPATTLFVNLDNVGKGTLHYLTGEGMLAYHPYGPDLLKAAFETAQGRPDQVLPRRNLLLPTDGLIPARAGYQTITFISFDAAGHPAQYHWYTDTLARVDQQFLARVEKWLHSYLERLVGNSRADYQSDQ